jgi:cytochrome c
MHLKRQPPEDWEFGLATAALFCRETARYYHPHISATYSLRTSTVKHIRSCRDMGDRLGFCAAAAFVTMAGAQMPAAAKPPRMNDAVQAAMRDCHTKPVRPDAPGPTLFKIVEAGGGKADGFHHSAGFAEANFVWDDTRLDAYLANPQAMVAAPSWPTASRSPRPRRHHRLSEGVELNGKARSLDDPRIRRGKVAGLLRAFGLEVADHLKVCGFRADLPAPFVLAVRGGTHRQFRSQGSPTRWVTATAILPSLSMMSTPNTRDFRADLAPGPLRDQR